MNFNIYTIKQNSLLIRAFNQIDFLSLDYYEIPMYLIDITNRDPETLAKSLNFISRYSRNNQYELFVVNQDIELLDLPYAILGDCDDQQMTKVAKINIKLNKIINSMVRENRMTIESAKDLKSHLYNFMGDFDEIIDSDQNPDYVIDKFICQLELSGWFRYSCTPENDYTSEIMLCKYGKDNISRINLDQVKDYLDTESFRIVTNFLNQ